MSRILIVDDTPDVRALVRARLEAVAHEIVGEATTGREAIAAARSLEPDVIVLDVMMPDIGGLEALPELRRVAPEARVLVYSSVAGLTIDEVRRLGGHGLLRKAESAKLAEAVDALSD